jgi:hypothetical protein
MPTKIRVMDPRGYPPMVKGKRLANRIESLDGKVLFLIDCLFDNADVFMEQLRVWFSEHMPRVETRMIKPKESWVDDAEMRAKVVKDGDAAIIGVGL